MSMRRFTRLTNAFSKKFENHAHMVALYTVWYNSIRIHKTLKMSPAMAAGMSATLWSMDDLCEKMDAVAPSRGRAGHIKNGRRLHKDRCASDAFLAWILRGEAGT
jgi:hypothetical protein